MNRTANSALLGSVIQAAELAIAAHSISIAANASALGGKSLLLCSEVTTVGGAALEVIASVGVLATDKVFVQMVDPGTGVVSVVKAECAADAINVTFSGDPGNDAKVNILVVR